MTETRVSLTRSSGWTRLALPGAMSVIFATPMLWAVGTFDSAPDPMLRSIVFGLSGILFFSLTPWLIGWAVQGFVIRRKPTDDSDDAPAARSSAPRPASPAPRPGSPASASRGKGN